MAHEPREAFGRRAIYRCFERGRMEGIHVCCHGAIKGLLDRVSRPNYGSTVNRDGRNDFGLLAVRQHRHMSRILAVLFATFLFGLVVVVAKTEQNHPAEQFQMSVLVLNATAQVLLVVGLVLYCGFAALHSTQHVISPQERSTWLVFTIVFNVLGSCWYFLTAYQSFRKIGKGRLMAFRNAKRA